MVVSAAAHFRDASADVDMLDGLTESSMDALKDVVQPSAMAPQFSVLETAFDSIGRNQPEGTTSNAEPRTQIQLQQQFNAALTAKTPVWNPTAKLNNDRVAGNTVTNRQEAGAKVDDARTKMSELRSEVQDITRKMDAGGPQADAAAAGPQSPSMMGSLAGGLARDLAITGGLTAVGMPFAAAAAGAASLAAAVTGRGTFGVANSGEFGRATDRRGRSVDAGYTRNEPSPSEQQASGPAAPQSSALWNRLANGPGFGRDGRERADAGSVDLAGQSLTGIAALKLAENSPVMRAYQSQRLDGESVQKIHQARIEKGVVADAPNVAQVQNMGIALADPALNRPALPGLHV